MKNHVYNNEEIAFLAQQVKKVCSKRYEGLDAWNADCKAVTRLLAQFEISDIEWVGDWSDTSCQVGWHDETIVYRTDSCRVNLNEGLPLHEAPAEIRWLIKQEALIEKLLHSVIDKVKGFCAGCGTDLCSGNLCDKCEDFEENGGDLYDEAS